MQAWRSFASSEQCGKLSKQFPPLDNRLGAAGAAVNAQLESLNLVGLCVSRQR